jgi:hypothetical protein
MPCALEWAFSLLCACDFLFKKTVLTGRKFYRGESNTPGKAGGLPILIAPNVYYSNYGF